METLSKKLPFLMTLMAVVGVSIGTLAFSQAVGVGAETDVGLETDVFVPDPINAQPPQPGGSPVALPPAAPLDEPDDDDNDGAVAADAAALPATGSGGYLNSEASTGATAGYILALLAAGLTLGGAALAYARNR